MMEPLVSVVVVSYNCEDTILDILHDLEKTDYPSLEILVIDNYSSDGTWEVTRKWAEHTERLYNTLLGDRGHCFGAALNLGIASSHGELVAIVNDDVRTVTPSWLRVLVHAILDNPELAVVGPALLEPDARTVQSGGLRGPFHAFYIDPLRGRAYEMIPKGLRKVDSLVGAVLLFRRDVFTMIGGFDEALSPILFEDTDILWRIVRCGATIGWVPESYVVHLGGASFGRDRNVGEDERIEWYCRHSMRSILKNSSAVALLGELAVLVSTIVIYHRTKGIKRLLSAARWNFGRLGETLSLRKQVFNLRGVFVQHGT